ncbi:DNA primase [Sphingosinicella sp. BN140058]|uniref:DNA primase n=1 Tax=Sphingosinicella sp. BN140058 TaxID=1892855 RepID=UPI0010129B25|nr:DNA primase [Sphingosinicella sp. BN140058]QAY79379.1 DNA primase [Sphingosinicella sp. BN140058]
MSLSPQFLDEVRARTSLSTVIGRSVKLQKAGREYKACCPFHQEKTPSFTINDEKGFYHCFGCGAHGDAIRFLTDARGLPFMEAVKELADAAGLEVPAPDPRAQQKAERAAGLYDVVEAAQAWFVAQLGSIEGAHARAYLQKRGLRESTIVKFGFGFAPDSRGKLREALKRFGNEALVETGLLIAPEDDREPYDRFRGRLMIPIRDQRGRVIAFGGRILGDGEPKYLNSPETPLFDKGRTLYNLDKAGPASRAARRIVVVEGYLDVIALDQAGIGEAVAPLGTALTEGQLDRIWKLSPAPILCFDGDSAGQKASVRAALRALPNAGPGRSLGFVTLPAGQDPDDLVRAKGRDALEALLAAPEPLVDRVWRHEITAEPLTTPEERAGLKQRLFDLLGSIGDANVREQYRAELLRRFDELTRPQRPQRDQGRPPYQSGGGRFQPGRPQSGRFGNGRFQNGRFGFVRPVSEQAKSVANGGLDPRWLRAVLAGLVRHPEVIAAHSEAVAALPIVEANAVRLRDSLLSAALLHGELDQERLNTILIDEGVAPLAEALRQERGLAFSFTRRDVDPERAQRDLVLVIDTLAAQPGIETALAAATEWLKESGDEAAFQEQQRLRMARDEAEKQLAALVEGEAS